MKFPFGKKDTAPIAPASPAVAKSVVKVRVVPVKSPSILDGKKQIISGLIFISASFIGAVFILYLTINAQSAKEVEVKDINQKLIMVSTEKDEVSSKAEALQSQVGRVLNLEKVVSASQKVHGEKEADRKDGALWIDRKTATYMVTLGALNGVSKGSRLSIFDGENKVGTLKVTSALDVVSYGEPVDRKMTDFTRDYYQVKAQ